MSDYREAMRKSRAANNARASAKVAYEAYCSVLEDELNTLYEEVQKDFWLAFRIERCDERRVGCTLGPVFADGLF